MPDLRDNLEVLILGGGPAGLSTAWALEGLGRSYMILEAAPFHGGNARTISNKGFRYDTGPHRFHDRDPLVTERVLKLMDGRMHETAAPSRILWNGRFVDFPLRPLQALFGGGMLRAGRAAADLLRARILGRSNSRGAHADFASWAYDRFGETIADSFLIPFSEKLWGLPAAQLSPEIAGRRLPGFGIGALLKEAFFSKKADHLEGRFYYPRLGYGEIIDEMARRLAPGAVRCGARVTGIHAEGCRIAAVEFEGRGRKEIATAPFIVNTLPITSVIRMMSPRPPDALFNAADQLRFRDVVLAVLFLDQESVSNAACIYFSDPRLEFTRAHEPRNRSRHMSPPRKTSLVVEFPCFKGDDIWTRDDRRLVAGLVHELESLGVVRAERVEDSNVVRMQKAYPIYSIDYHRQAGQLLDYLDRYENLETLGRGGGFFYGHLHDMVAAGYAVAEVADKLLDHRSGSVDHGPDG